MNIPTWVNSELSNLNLGDKRLDKRAKMILSEQYAKPQGTFHSSAEGLASVKAIYRFKKK